MRQNGQYLVATTSGFRSLTSLPSGPNTFEKTFHLLLNRLQPDQRQAVSMVLGTAPWPWVQQIKELVESLSDAQFDVFVQALDCAATTRIRKYLDICALPYTPTQQLSKGHAAVCPYHQPAFTLETKDPPKSDTVVQHMHDAPPEIFQVITDHFLQASFKPGYLFPDQGAYGYGKHIFEGKCYYDPNPHAFLALNQTLLTRYQEAFWEENIWVIGPGDRKSTLDFLDRLGDTAVRVKKMRLAFSNDDICGASDFHANLINNSKAKTKRSGLMPNNLALLERFSSECDSLSNELCSIWWSKYLMLTFLHLRELTLDLRNAYGPDDKYLPNPIWMNTLPRFRNGMPSTFNILARDAGLVEDAHVVLKAINQ